MTDILVHIFNTILIENNKQVSFKIVFVTPIHKRGNKSDLSNY